MVKSLNSVKEFESNVKNSTCDASFFFVVVVDAELQLDQKEMTRT